MTFDSAFKAIPVPVAGTVQIIGTRVAGLICATAGTFTFTIVTGEGPDVVLPAITLAAGQQMDIPFFAGSSGRSTLVAGAGASGILFTT